MAARRWILPAAVTGVGAFYLALFALAPAHLPALNVDSEGYLAVARWVAGAGRTPQQVSAYYAFGYGLPLAIPYLFTTSIHAVYHYAVALNVLAGALMVLPLRALAREAFALPPGRATLAAAGAAVYPGVALQVGQVWPLVPLALVTSWYALALLRLLRKPSARRALGAAVLAVALFALHHRMVPVPVVTAFALLHVTAGRSRKTVVPAAAVLLVGCAAVLAVDRAVIDALYPLGTGALGISRGVAVSGAGRFARILVGELWYLAVAPVGLVALGVIAVLRDRAPGMRALGLAMTVALVGTAVLGALQLEGVGPLTRTRIDYLAYGRYVDPYAPLFLAAGLAALLGRRPRVAAAGALGVAGATVAQVVAQGAISQAGAYQKAALPGLLGADALFGGAGPSFGRSITYVGIAVLAAAAAIAVVLLAGRRPVAAATLPIVLLATLGALGAAAALRSYYSFIDTYYARLPAVLRAYPPGAAVAFVARGETVEAMDRLQMFEPGRPVRALRSGGEAVRDLPPLAFGPAGLRTIAGSPARQVALLDVRGLPPQALYELRSISSIR